MADEQGQGREEDEEDYREEIEFDHVCGSCGHVICNHFYQFEVNEEKEVQEYLMECFLCGRGASTVSTSSNTYNSNNNSESKQAPAEAEVVAEIKLQPNIQLQALAAAQNTASEAAEDSDNWDDN
jgi:hypothetical protein